MSDWPVAMDIASTRVLLEPLTPEHSVEMVEVLAAPELYEYIGGTAPSGRELRQRYVRQAEGRSPDGTHGWLNWIIRRRDLGDAIGFTQATLTRTEAGLTGDIAWLVDTRHQGDGYASEAAQAMIAWLQEHHVVQFRADIAPENGPSVGVARRLGLHLTGISVDGEDRWASSR